MKKEFTVKPMSGYVALLMALLFLGGAIAGFAFEIIWLGVVLTLLFILMVTGFKVVNPNSSCVMVLLEMALEQLSYKKIVDLDEEKKAAMVSNLMVVLCGYKDATPVVNTGTLHS